jgi:hypothetical protein
MLVIFGMFSFLVVEKSNTKLLHTLIKILIQFKYLFRRPHKTLISL